MKKILIASFSLLLEMTVFFAFVGLPFGQKLGVPLLRVFHQQLVRQQRSE
jgi:hypothetical protein